MKVLIVGANGQAGRELQRTAPATVELVCLDVDRLDITHRQAVLSTVSAIAPDLLINAAAYTAVDRAEQEPALAYAVNAAGAGHLAEAARASKARLVHISTDFVFDGGKSSPYLPEDEPRPLGVYGASKLAGERLAMERSDGQAIILRTAWLYAANGQNFVHTMLQLMRERDELGIVADQIGTPTWARTLARTIWAITTRPELTGLYHCTDAGVASWYDFAVAIQEEALALGLLAKAIPIRPLRSKDYPTPAQRPAYSVLDKSASWAVLATSIPVHWRVNLRAMLAEVVAHA